MSGTQETRGAQAALWNGASGRAWVEEQVLLDRLFAPFRDRLVEAVAAAAPRAVLDVGCGAGGTTLAIARQLGADGRVTGIDISEPLLEAARARADAERLRVAFVRADAQDYAFEPAGVDMIVSRFGVMFFDDPTGAFTNLRRAARPGAPLVAIAWRGAADNPFMTAAERAAGPLLADLPPRRPGVPGQFAFADEDRVQAILTSSGWTAVDVSPLDVECRLSAADLLTYATRLGPVGLALRDTDAATRERVLPVVRDAFAPFMVDGECRFTAACWRIGARA